MVVKLLMGISVFVWACAAGLNEPESVAQKVDPIKDAMERAKKMASTGDHLGAGRNYEAALGLGGGEKEILPQLIAAQVRSGRLLAALESSERLREVIDESPALDKLYVLLKNLTHMDESPVRREVVK